jgi:DNA-binding MarR family transcriptional regulator
MIDLAQEITLKAFLLAVAQLEPPIAPEIDAVLPTIKQDLDEQPNRALETINHLVAQHPELERLYNKARKTLRQQYGSQERDKLLTLNLSLRKPEAPQQHASNHTLHKFSTNFAAIVQQVTPELQRHRQDNFANLFSAYLAVAEGRTKLLDYSVLSAIEQNLLTTEDLAYRLKLPIEQMEQIVHRLWQEGKITRIDGSIWHKIFPFVKPKKCPHRDSVLTLTAIGHFRIHPVLRLNGLGA